MVPYLQRIVCQLLIKLILSTFFVTNLVGCHSLSTPAEILPYYNSVDLTPHWDSKNTHTIAYFNLMDQTGKNFNSDSLIGKIYIANFFFTKCPSICPKMTKNLKILQDSIYGSTDIDIVSFSVMPWIDSVNKLKTYSEDNQINPARWHLLTGEKSIIYTLGRSSFFADNNMSSDTSSFLHTDKMYLIDQHQQIRGVYNATNRNDISRVINDLAILKKAIH